MQEAHGIYSYRFERSTDGTNFTDITTQISNTYTYEGLTDGTTYYLRVTVIDKVGNSYTGEAITQATEKVPIILPDTTTPEGYEIVGKYVDYTPKTGSYTALAKYTGATEDQVFTTDTSLKWRIWRANSEELILFPDKLMTETTETGERQTSSLTLHGCNGVDNGPTLLKEMSQTLYSYESIGTGRQLTLSSISKAIGREDDVRISISSFSSKMTYVYGSTFMSQLSKLSKETYLGVMEDTRPLSESSLVKIDWNTREQVSIGEKLGFSGHPLEQLLTDMVKDEGFTTWIGTRKISFGETTDAYGYGDGRLNVLTYDTIPTNHHIGILTAPLVTRQTASTNLGKMVEYTISNELLPLVEINLDRVNIFSGDDDADFEMVPKE